MPPAAPSDDREVTGGLRVITRPNGCEERAGLRAAQRRKTGKRPAVALRRAHLSYSRVALTNFPHPNWVSSGLFDVPYDPARAIEGRADAFQIRKPGLDYCHSKFIRQTFSELQLFNNFLRLSLP
jgi:hypothetical protein